MIIYPRATFAQTAYRELWSESTCDGVTLHRTAPRRDLGAVTAPQHRLFTPVRYATCRFGRAYGRMWDIHMTGVLPWPNVRQDGKASARL